MSGLIKLEDKSGNKIVFHESTLIGYHTFDETSLSNYKGLVTTLLFQATKIALYGDFSKELDKVLEG